MRDKLPKLQIAETLPNSGKKHDNRRSNSNGANNRDGRNILVTNSNGHGLGLGLGLRLG